MNEKGFSLIEIIITIVIVGITAIPISRLTVLNLKSTVFAGETFEALSYAEASLEEVTAYSKGQGYEYVESSHSFYLTLPDHLSRSFTVAEDSLKGVVYKEITVSIDSDHIEPVHLTTLIVR